MDYNLCDISVVKSIITRHGFTFSKAFGQNFLIDSEVCPKMAELLEADRRTGVIEIGPGVGVLTKELCRVAGKVCAIELDKRLFAVLDETLCDFKNLEIIEGDALELDLNGLISEHLSDCSEIKVCANLPYYITSPIVMKLLSENSNISEIEVMVQREAAQRLCAEPGTRQAGAVSVAVKYYGESEILFDVGKESFFPAPKVDSAVIKIRLNKDKKYDIANEKQFFSFVKAAFSQRRKTFVNSVSATLGIEKSRITEALEELGLGSSIRAENITMEEFVSLYKRLFDE